MVISGCDWRDSYLVTMWCDMMRYNETRLPPQWSAQLRPHSLINRAALPLRRSVQLLLEKKNKIFCFSHLPNIPIPVLLKHLGPGSGHRCQQAGSRWSVPSAPLSFRRLFQVLLLVSGWTKRSAQTDNPSCYLKTKKVFQEIFLFFFSHKYRGRTEIATLVLPPWVTRPRGFKKDTPARPLLGLRSLCQTRRNWQGLAATRRRTKGGKVWDWSKVRWHASSSAATASEPLITNHQYRYTDKIASTKYSDTLV